MDESAATEVTEVWHYTTAEGLKAIVESDTLLAGAAIQMNDSRELLEGYDFVRQEINRMGGPDDEAHRHAALKILGTAQEATEAARHLFSLSGSSDGDNLSLWRAYGGPGSFAIKLAPTTKLFPIVNPALLSTRLTKSELPGLAAAQPYPHCAAKFLKDWERVHYDNKKAKQDAEALYLTVAHGRDHDYYSDMFKEYRYELMARTKHATFSAEEEVRKTFRVARPEAFVLPMIRGTKEYRFIKVGNAGEQAQSEVVNINEKELLGCITKPEKLPILEVKLSLTGHQPGAEQALQAFLEAQRYHGIRVSFSDSPFRERP